MKTTAHQTAVIAKAYANEYKILFNSESYSSDSYMAEMKGMIKTEKTKMSM